MNEERQQKFLGLVCTLIGGAFVLAGIIFFIMSNYMNFQMKKTDATVIAMYAIETIDGEQHTMTELSYRVGTELVFASYEYPGVLSEETASLDIFYNIKEPTMVFDGEWMWQPLLVLVLGVPVLITGLYYLGIIKLEALKLTAPSKNASTNQKELYKAQKNTVENILPMLAGILFIAFGIIMLISRGEWWTWMFIVIGAVELLYIGMEFIPALLTWINLSRVNKLKKKAKVYDVEMSEDKESESDDKENKSGNKVKDKKAKKENSAEAKDYIEEEDLAPFEIKNIKGNKSAQKRAKNKKKKK